MTKKIAEYGYSLLHDIVNDTLRPCMRNSFILQWYDSTTELLKAVGIKMSEAEFDKIEQFQKDTITYKSNPKRVEKELKLEDYFDENMSKKNRNEAILKAYHDGFRQSEIAKFLGLTGAGVSKILKKLRVAV